MVNGRPPYRLRLFGGTKIEGPEGPLTGRPARRHVLGLIARLATAPGNTMARETLMAFLWPESDARSARRLLNAAVYDLRKALGGAVVRTEGANLHLDVDLLRPDAVEFERAIEAHDLQGAAALYAGIFLDGFHLPDALEFEEWVEQTRERYARKNRACLEELARQAEAAGNWTAAERWWGRLAAEDPSDAHVVLALMRVLDRAGARGRALERAEAYERVLREEFGAEPDPAVVGFVQRLRQGPAIARRAPDENDRTPAGEIAAVRPFPRPWVAAFGSLAGLALLATALLSGRGGEATTASPERIAVLPFTVNAETRYSYLGEGIVDLLGAKLNVPGQVRPVDANAILAFVHESKEQTAVNGRRVAERFAAGTYVQGTIVQSGDALVVHASLYDRAGRRLGTAEVTIPDEEELLEGLDRLASQLLIDHLGMAGDALMSDAALATRSLPALKAYLAGERAFRAARFEEAAREFGRAAAEDSTFVFASYRMSLANLWADRPQTQPFDIDQMALRHSVRLPERPRLLIEAYAAWRAGEADTAERLYQRILAIDPDDVEALHQLGETRFHYNPVRGRPIVEAREPFERVLRLQPTHWGALWHLAQLAAFEGRAAEFDRILARLEQFDPTPTKALEIRALRTFARGDTVAVERLLPELGPADATVLASLALKVGVFMRNLDGAAQVARLLTEPERPKRHRAYGFALLTYLETARGRPSAARAHLAALDRVDDRGEVALMIRTLLFLLPPAENSMDELDEARRTVMRWEAHSGIRPPLQEDDFLRPYLLGLLSAALGDTTEALKQVAELEHEGHADSGARATAIRAEVLRRGGRPAEALEVLRKGWRTEWFGWAVSSPYSSQSYERYVRAELSLEEGHLEDALGWFASFEAHGLFDLAYLAPSHLKRAEIYQRMGRTEEAARQYERFIALWKECDPELRPVVEEATRKLASLNASS